MLFAIFYFSFSKLVVLSTLGFTCSIHLYYFSHSSILEISKGYTINTKLRIQLLTAFVLVEHCY